MEPITTYKNFPMRGNAFSRAFGRFGLRLCGGWRVVGEMPDIAKAIVPVAPHTSNWDFFIGMFSMLALGIRLSFLGKHQIFRFPVRGILTWLGGIPVNRANANGVVADITKAFLERERLILALSPEGTRKKVIEWRLGFLYMARDAQVPLIPVALDFSRREVRIGQAIQVNEDIAVTLAEVKHFTGQARGKYPEHE